jgi:hypothetical protein
MPLNPKDDQLLRSYLLGELPEGETERLESRLLEDDELFLLGEAIEADLLAAVDRGELAAAEKERVLHRLAASAAGREGLALARSLNAAADRLAAVKSNVIPISSRRAAVPPRYRTRWAALAAAVLLAVIGAWLAVQTMEQRGPVTQATNDVSAPAGRARPAAPRGPAAPAAPVLEESPAGPDRVARQDEPVSPPRNEPPAPPKIYPFSLSLMTLRGAEVLEEPLRIPAGTDIVEIRLDLEGLENVESFDAAVRNEEGGTVWEENGLKPRRLEEGTTLVLEVPAQRLPPGRYEVTVTAGTERLPGKELEVVRENQ